MKLDDAYYKGMDAGLGKSIRGNGKGKDEQVPPKGKGKGKAHSGKKGGAAETPAGKHNHAVIAWTCKVCGETHSNPTCSYCRECGCLRGQTWEEAQREHTLFLQKEVAAPSSTPAGSPPGPKDQAQQHPRPQGRAAKVRDGQLTFLDDILARPIEGEEVSESTVLMTDEDEAVPEPTKGSSAALKAQMELLGDAPEQIVEHYQRLIKEAEAKEANEAKKEQRPLCHQRALASISSLEKTLRTNHVAATTKSTKEQEDLAKQIAELQSRQAVLLEAAKLEQESFDSAINKIALARERIPLIAPLEEAPVIDLTKKETAPVRNMVSADQACSTIRGKLEGILQSREGADPAFATSIRKAMKEMADELLTQCTAIPTMEYPKDPEEISELGDIALSEMEFPMNAMSPVQAHY